MNNFLLRSAEILSFQFAVLINNPVTIQLPRQGIAEN